MQKRKFRLVVDMEEGRKSLGSKNRVGNRPYGAMPARSSGKSTDTEGLSCTCYQHR